jgi:hypothetical protein
MERLPVDEAKRAELLDLYERGDDRLAAALDTLTEADLDNRSGPGEWSPREIVHHLAVSELIGAVRLRRLIAEKNPAIQPYDQEAYARRLFSERPLDASLGAIKYAIRTNAGILRRLSDEQWTTGGTHLAMGPFDIDRWLTVYSGHLAGHVEQLARASRGSAESQPAGPEAERPEELTRLIERYEQGPRLVFDALAGITAAELDHPEAPGEWSPRQVVHHLADSETTSVTRFFRLLVEDRPAIKSYDQDHFAAVLFYDRPIDNSLGLFRSSRETAALVLRRLGPDDWRRIGVHSDDGEFTVADWLRSYARHAEDHADQIRRARASALAT